jgi:hypothetical protein
MEGYLSGTMDTVVTTVTLVVWRRGLAMVKPVPRSRWACCLLLVLGLWAGFSLFRSHLCPVTGKNPQIDQRWAGNPGTCRGLHGWQCTLMNPPPHRSAVHVQVAGDLIKAVQDTGQWGPFNFWHRTPLVLRGCFGCGPVGRGTAWVRQEGSNPALWALTRQDGNPKLQGPCVFIKRRRKKSEVAA